MIKEKRLAQIEERASFIVPAREDVPVLCAALREAQAQAAAMGRVLEDAHDALGELLSDNGKDWDDLTDWTGNPSWQGLKGRIDAVLKEG